MTTLAVTGHMDLSDDTVSLVRADVKKLLGQYDPEALTGVSCIAKGADALFAQEVLAGGARLVVVVPSQDYREVKVKPEHAPLFDQLVEQATEIVVLPHETANRQAYEAANAELIRRGDRLVAVWDGAPPSGKGGGTADTVEQARAAGLPVDVVWPDGATRGR